MNSYFTVLKAMFKNKLRISSEKSKRSVFAFFIFIGIMYFAVMFALISIIVELKQLFAVPEATMILFFFMLMTAGLIVLIFGIVSLVTTLFLAKDTDFYSILPVKSSVVFAAKLSYVYISEAVIVTAVLLPLIITLGVVAKAWAWFYVISIAMLAVIPAFPLLVAAIVAIPVMFIASKLKNRGVVALIFYLVLFGGFFGLYIAFVYVTTDINISDETLYNIVNGITAVTYVMFPYRALASAVAGLPTYGLGVGASTAVNTVIFFGSSAALFVILLVLGKFMYAQSAKANNQTDNSKAKNGKFKSGSGLKALMKREYISSLRTTQVAFQCYAVFILPIIMVFVLFIPFRNLSHALGDGVGFLDKRGNLMVGFSTLAAMLATLGNAASTTFSREGGAMASLKILPVSIKQILKAKIIAWLVIALPVAAVSVMVANILVFDLQFMFLSVFSLIPLAAMFVIFGALWDLKSPKLKWTDPMQAVKHNGHTTIGQLLCMVGGLLSIVLYFSLLIDMTDINTIITVCWSVIYGTLVIFAAANIYLYKKVEAYYKRIEI
ncbi:MAG: hypothetical protein J1G01_02125 [Clostridiales bacterium]|nr:hypothetical protein [Clostridiales bacterium]